MRFRRQDRDELVGENLRLRSEVKRLRADLEDVSHRAAQRVDWLLAENARLTHEARKWRDSSQWWEAAYTLTEEAHRG